MCVRYCRVTPTITYLYFVFVKRSYLKKEKKRFICSVLYKSSEYVFLWLPLPSGDPLGQFKSPFHFIFPMHSPTLSHPPPVHLKRKIFSREHEENLYRCLYSILSKCQFFVVSFGYLQIHSCEDGAYRWMMTGCGSRQTAASHCIN